MKWVFSLVLASMVFVSCSGQSAKQNKVEVQRTADTLNVAEATFAAGCFWCEEAIFESVMGVRHAVSGYAGGTKPNPTYYDLGSGPTCHAEMINIEYDSSVIDYPTLLKIYFASQDPTQVNGQGPDRGAQYRSIVFYRNEAEKQEAQKQIVALNKNLDEPVTVQLVPFTKFWVAEAHHQNFVARNPANPYVLQESIPRIRRFQKKFPELIKPGMFY